jgi:hypothetical protein
VEADYSSLRISIVLNATRDAAYPSHALVASCCGLEMSHQCHLIMLNHHGNGWWFGHIQTLHPDRAGRLST